MSETAKSGKPARKPPRRRKAAATAVSRSWWQRSLRWAGRGALGLGGMILAFILLFALVNPPTTPYMLAESLRRGGVERDWVALEDMAPDMARSVVAGEDANFCEHWGFDIKAIRAALDRGDGGASTISQQVAKNVFLWQGRSWPRKALEALITPLIELVWTKRRIVEVYLNVAETGPGVFGAEAAARHYFKVSAKDLSPVQAARIAAILPNPKGWNAARPTGYLRARTAAIRQGADTIAADGRAACFED